MKRVKSPVPCFSCVVDHIHRRGAKTYAPRMSYLSDWHACDPSDRSTFPKVSARVQIRYKNGSLFEGNREDFFPQTGLLTGSLINGWRYIRDREF